MQTLILAGTHTEANAYTRAAELPRGSWRIARSAGAIKGIRRGEIHILPGFLVRPDRHKVLAALRYCKSEIFYVDFVDGKILSGYEDVPQRHILGLGQTPAAVEGDPRGPLTDRVLEVAYRYNGLRDVGYGTTEESFLGDPDEEDDDAAAQAEDLKGFHTTAEVNDATPAPVDKTSGRRTRRKRCLHCENLVEPEDYDAHVAAHENTPKPPPTPAPFTGSPF